MVFDSTLGTLQTFQKVVVGFCPAVSVVGGKDPNRFFVCLEGGVPYLLQLNEELVSGKGTSITVVNIQLKELTVRRVDKDRDRTREKIFIVQPQKEGTATLRR